MVVEVENVFAAAHELDMPVSELPHDYPVAEDVHRGTGDVDHEIPHDVNLPIHWTHPMDRQIHVVRDFRVDVPSLPI